jgi:hypothetical protein
MRGSILSHLWRLKAGQEVASSAFRSHWGVAPAKAPFSLKRNLPFHQLFLDLLLSGSGLKGRECKEGGRELRVERKKKAWVH